MYGMPLPILGSFRPRAAPTDQPVAGIRSPFRKNLTRAGSGRESSIVVQVQSAQGASAADELFATETMAELCARQGRFGDAVAIYRRLLEGAVDATKCARWQARMEELDRAPLVAGAPPARLAASVSPASAAPRTGLGRLALPRGDALARRAAEAAAPAPVSVSSSEELRLPMLVTQPVRSGQVVYAVKTDLIVIAPVNPGAQLIADGNIHVYGPLRGRAVAGAKGCREARIFCRHLEAELVGVDTAYLTRESVPAARIGKPAQIRFESDAAGERCVIADLP
jgi:hypothetical protein